MAAARSADPPPAAPSTRSGGRPGRRPRDRGPCRAAGGGRSGRARAGGGRGARRRRRGDGGGRQVLFVLTQERSRVSVGRNEPNDVSLGWDSEVSPSGKELAHTASSPTPIPRTSRPTSTRVSAAVRTSSRVTVRLTQLTTHTDPSRRRARRRRRARACAASPAPSRGRAAGPRRPRPSARRGAASPPRRPPSPSRSCSAARTAAGWSSAAPARGF